MNVSSLSARGAAAEDGGNTDHTRRARIVAVDDRGFIRSNLRSIELSEQKVQITEAVRGGREFLRTLCALAPDLIVMDCGAMRPAELTEAVSELKQSFATVALLVLSARKDETSIEAAFRAGAEGYLLKDEARLELPSAIRSLLHNKVFLSPSICRRIVQAYLEGRARRRPPVPDGLTSREREVLTLIAGGYRNREIAHQLSLSHKTIEKHRSSLMRKLSLRTTAAVTTYAIANGYVHPGT